MPGMHVFEMLFVTTAIRSPSHRCVDVWAPPCSHASAWMLGEQRAEGRRLENHQVQDLSLIHI
eukprot:326424-Chlamydomonas_euryale.AAC.1